MLFTTVKTNQLMPGPGGHGRVKNPQVQSPLRPEVQMSTQMVTQ